MIVAILGALYGALPCTADDVSEQAPPPSPDGPVNYVDWLTARHKPSGTHNAALQYLSAFTYLSPIGNPQALEQAALGPWDDVAEVDQWLSENKRGLRLFQWAGKEGAFRLGFRAGKGVPGGPDWANALLFVTIPGLGSFHLAAYGMLADGWGRWQEGDQTVLIDNAFVNLAAAHRLGDERAIVTRISGMVLAEQSYAALVRALALTEQRDQLAETLAARLSASDPSPAPLTEAYVFQKFVAWDILQRVYEPGTSGVSPSTEAIYGYLVKLTGGAAPKWKEVQQAVTAAGFDASLQEVNRFFEQLLTWNNLPYHSASSRTERIVEARNSLQNPLLRVLLADITKPRQTLGRTRTLHRGLHVLVQIFSFHSRRGGYPETLDELRSAIERHRVDPYSGRDFIYARTRESFVLYSVGSDGKDDAGRGYLSGGEAGDLVIWPPP